MPTLSHKLDLYRLAVQHPDAEAAFLARVYAHYNRGHEATLLKEDFAGGAALATAWVALSGDHQAMAVDRHVPTARFAWRRAVQALGPRAADLHVLAQDVMGVKGPKVDVVAATNFSVFFCHTREALRAYFRAARRALHPGGIFLMDAYGGPGAWRVGEQRRRVDTKHRADAIATAARTGGPPRRTIAPFDYIWEQRSCDAITARVDCRIHFELPGGKRIRSAFHYDWRLWSLPELTETMLGAGFSRAEVWCDPRADGVYRPVQTMPTREDWVAYGVGQR